VCANEPEPPPPPLSEGEDIDEALLLLAMRNKSPPLAWTPL
jgi:hypothetical protein